VLAAARSLIGARLVRVDDAGERVARITEVEAYGGPEDRASHARFGATPRTASMFGRPGIAYVYRVYGIHACLNVVTGPAGTASAVLLRAAEPLAGIDRMRAARVARAVATRAADRADPAAAARRIARLPASRLAHGPANLAAAFGVDVAEDGRDLLDAAGVLRLEPAPRGEAAATILATPRVGVAYAGPGWADRPWRLVVSPGGRGLGAGPWPGDCRAPVDRLADADATSPGRPGPGAG
jgi:DNA-3-methyladenine glycosylase